MYCDGTELCVHFGTICLWKVNALLVPNDSLLDMVNPHIWQAASRHWTCQYMYQRHYAAAASLNYIFSHL